MEFETITLNEIKPSKYNPRIITPEEQEKLEKTDGKNTQDKKQKK